MRCKRPGCHYLRHDDPKNNGGLYCCRACKMGLGHGGNCQKIQYDTRSVVNVTNLVLKAWGKSTYGHYLKFKFKNNGSIPDIDEINYQLRVATVKGGVPRLIDSGTIPYLYDNTQIIYTKFSIIDKYLILGIQTKNGSLLGQYCFGRKLLLSSSPFLNCNYFADGGSTSTTTTTTINTTITTNPNFTTTYAGDPFIYIGVGKKIICGLVNPPSSPLDFPPIPGTVLSITDNAFNSGLNAAYANLEGAVIFPPSLTYIGKNAFYACAGISGLDFAGATGLLTIDDNAFEGTINVSGLLNIPNGVIRIGKNAFSAVGFSSLLGPILSWNPDLSDLTVIDNSAFLEANCNGNLIFPKKLVRIGKNAFNSSSIDSIAFGYSGSNITVDDGAFVNCYDLSGTLVLTTRNISFGINVFEGGSYDSIVFPPTITTIPTGFFYANQVITNFIVPAFITSIEDVRSSGSLTGHGAFDNCTNLTSLTFEPYSRLTIIGSFAFSQGQKIEGNICIPKSVQTIGSQAFDTCINISSLTLITGALTYIKDYAFSSCTSLACIVVVPPSVTNILVGAFSFNQDSLIVFYPYNVNLASNVFQKNNGASNIPHFAYKVTLASTVSGFQVNRGGLTTNKFVVGNHPSKNYHLYWSENPPTDLTDESQYELSVDEETFSAPHSEGFFWIKYSVSSSSGTGPPLDIWYSNILHIELDPFSYEDPGKTIINGLVNLPTGPFSFPLIPPNATSIKSNAFNADSAGVGNDAYFNLTGTVVIPPTITYIGLNAFYGCMGLTSLDLSSATGLLTIDDSAFEATMYMTGDIVIPNSVTRIGKLAFRAYSLATSVAFNLTLGTNLSIIDDRVFEASVNLVGSLTIGHNITEIGDKAFASTNLSSIDFGTSGSSFTIANQAFFEIETCTGTLTLPSRITSLGENVFDSCGYDEIIYPSSLTYIPSGCFNGLLNLITYTIPKHITILSSDPIFGCFSNCTNLTSVNFESPSQLQLIGSNAFNTCVSLEKIDIPPSVITIGALAFQGKLPADTQPPLSSLISATFCGTNLTTINAGAFSWCISLTGIIVLPPSVNYIGEDAFFQCPSSLTVYYPATATLYKAFDSTPKPAHFSYQVFITLKPNRTGINVNLGGATTNVAPVLGLVSGKKYHIMKSNNPPIDLTTNSGYQDSFLTESIDFALTSGYYWMKYSVNGTNVLYSNTLFVA